MIEFLRIEKLSTGLVAVFQFGFSEEFKLNKASLESRIQNVKDGFANPDRDASVELAALAELKRQESL